MKVILKKQVGDLELTIEAEGKNEKEIFPQLAFWTSLPSSHPSGAKDFQLKARPAKTRKNQTVTYYEIWCPSTGERFCLGQATDTAGGGLFPKGWQRIVGGEALPEEAVLDEEIPLKVKRLSVAEMQQMAQALVNDQRVSVGDGKCAVTSDNRVFTVMRDVKKNLVCTCDRFKLQEDCEHVWAVKLRFSTPQQQAA